MAQLKSTQVTGDLSVTGLSKATDFKGITAELSGTVSIGGETNIDNTLSAKKFLIKNNNDVTIGHTYTGSNYLELVLGNSTDTSATNGAQGYLYLYGTKTAWTKFVSGNPTANNTLTLPTASGTIALTSNIPGAEKGITLTGGKYGHSNTAITAGSVGSAQNPSHGGTFAIPKITYDAYGHITGATTVNIKLPADNNTDTKVTQTLTSSNASYPLLLAPNGQTATATTTAYFDSGITLNPSTNIITGAKLEYNYTSAPTQPDAVIKIGSSNFDVNIFKVFDYATGYKANGGGYGYSLMYNGTGEGVGNALTLYCDNQGNAEKVIGWQLNQSGQMGIKASANTSYSLYVSGASYFSGASTIAGALGVTGATTLNSTLTVSSTATLNGALNVKGNATLGDATGDEHKVNGNLTANGTIYLANGKTYKLDSAGNANLKTLQLDSAVKFQYNSTDKCVDIIFE